MVPYVNIWGEIISLPESVKIGAFCDIGNPDFGEECVIQSHVSIPPGWKFGSRVFIGPGARFANDPRPSIGSPFTPSNGYVGDDVVVGMGALIGPGVTLGRGCFIGMGAVVTKSVPPGETWIGNPAKQKGS